MGGICVRDVAIMSWFVAKLELEGSNSFHFV